MGKVVFAALEVVDAVDEVLKVGGLAAVLAHLEVGCLVLRSPS